MQLRFHNYLQHPKTVCFIPSNKQYHTRQWTLPCILNNSWSAPLSAHLSYPCPRLKAQEQVRRLVWNYDTKVCIEPHTALSVSHMNSPCLKIRWTYQTCLVITANYSTTHSMYLVQFDACNLVETLYNIIHHICAKPSTNGLENYVCILTELSSDSAPSLLYPMTIL